MRKPKLIAVLGTIVILATGCGNNKASKPNNQNPVEAILSSVPLSESLSATSDTLANCDADSAEKLLDQSFPTRAQSAAAFWNVCQQLYACSPTAAQFVSMSFASGTSFRMGFTNLKKSGVSQLGDRTGGVYVAYSQNVYLDTSLSTPMRGCHLLLHEIVHRLDPLAENGEHSLRTEYKAYWYQTAFIDDLLKLDNSLGAAVRAHIENGDVDQAVSPASTPTHGVLPFHTRESLLYSVAQAYGFEVDHSIVKRYPKLPREP